MNHSQKTDELYYFFIFLSHSKYLNLKLRKISAFWTTLMWYNKKHSILMNKNNYVNILNVLFMVEWCLLQIKVALRDNLMILMEGIGEDYFNDLSTILVGILACYCCSIMLESDICATFAHTTAIIYIISTFRKLCVTRVYRLFLVHCWTPVSLQTPDSEQ